MSSAGPGLRSGPGQVQKVRSRTGPEGPRTKDQRPGPGLYTKFGLPPPPPSQLFDDTQDEILNRGFETSNRTSERESSGQVLSRLGSVYS